VLEEEVNFILDIAIQTSKLEDRKFVTKDLKIHASTSLQLSGHLTIYGIDLNLRKLLANIY